MRKLTPKDAFSLARILKKTNIKETLQTFISQGQSAEDDDDVNNLGIDVMFAIVEACANEGIEDEIYKFLSGPFEMDPKEIESMDLDKLINMLKQLAEENDLKRFFNFAGK